jgi:hypothetical protein
VITAKFFVTHLLGLDKSRFFRAVAIDAMANEE